MLLISLDENIAAAEQRRNQAPVFDLALGEDAELLHEVRSLRESLAALEGKLTGKAGDPETDSLAAQALREFVLKLTGGLGAGLAGTITWGSRIALAHFAVGILQDLGIPVDEFYPRIREALKG